MGLRHERAIRDEAMGQLERLGVARYAAPLPGGIPYGIAKKVSIARALMEQPALLDARRTGVGARRERA